MPRFLIVPALVFLIIAMSSAFAETAGEKPAPSTDTPFLVRALVSGQTEIQTSKLATKKASDSVKAYADRTIEHRTKLEAQLQKLADQRDVHAPREATLYRKSLLDRLSHLDGRAFDRAFLEAMVDRQQSDIALFKRQLDYGADEAVKTFAKQTLPDLQERLKESQAMLKDADSSATQPAQPGSREGPTMMK